VLLVVTILFSSAPGFSVALQPNTVRSVSSSLEIGDTQAQSIPILGVYPNHLVGLNIPPTPKWAHDIILNASQVWNEAQLEFQKQYGGEVYRFVEASCCVNVEYATLPSGVMGFTTVAYSQLPSDAVLGGVFSSVTVLLPPDIFGVAEPKDVMVAFLIVLHELGHVLGLNELVGTHDAMDMFIWENQGRISTLDLFAVTHLASLRNGVLPALFIQLPNTIHYDGNYASLIEAHFLPHSHVSMNTGLVRRKRALFGVKHAPLG